MNRIAAARGSIQPGSLRAWTMAARPRTLTAACVPVLVGTAVAYVTAGVRWGPALAALLGSLLLQVGANLANDVFDFEKGADTAERLGPTRVVQAGLLSARAVRAGMVLVFALAMLIGVYLIAVGGWAVLAIGIASVLAALAYTGGPYPLGYHGFGDLLVMVFFGFVAVAGTALVQVDHVPALAWLAAIPVGALITAILVVNNLRDCHTDARAGKRTLAVRFGERGAVIEYLALVVAAYAVPALLYVTQQAGPAILLPFVTVPMAVSLGRAVAGTRGRALNPLLGRTALLVLFHGVSFAAGIALSAAARA